MRCNHSKTTQEKFPGPVPQISTDNIHCKEWWAWWGCNLVQRVLHAINITSSSLYYSGTAIIAGSAAALAVA